MENVLLKWGRNVNNQICSNVFLESYMCSRHFGELKTSTNDEKKVMNKAPFNLSEMVNAHCMIIQKT